MVGSQAQERDKTTTEYDDDGQTTRTGTLLTASAHITTAVIGAGVLSLAWSMAQLGWVLGSVSLFFFSAVTLYTSSLLADCYRTPDPVTGRRNYTYMDAVRNNLGEFQQSLCGIAQHANLVGAAIGYTITSAISMAALKRSSCFHKHGHDAGCHTSNNPYLIFFSAIQIFLSQLPNFHKLAVLSIIASVMSFAYSFIGVGLTIAKISEDGASKNITWTGTVVGVDVSMGEKLWKALQALGNIAFAYSFSNILIEIQDTLKSNPPENTVMKKATLISISVTTLFYVLCGVGGYVAFGNDAPGNFLTGFGFYEPFWLIDIGNLCIVIHLLGAYQIYIQPHFAFMEAVYMARWPRSKFLNKDVTINIPVLGTYPLNFFKLTWRTVFVIIMGVVAMLLPFFNDVLGILGAISFWPLTVHFPIEMYISNKKVPRFSGSWVQLKALSLICLLVSLLSAVACIQGLVVDVQGFQPFHSFS